MGQVVLNYLKSFGLVVAVFVLAAVASRLAATRARCLCHGQIRVFAFLLGSGLLLVAGIGRLGWPIQTWNGESQAEGLDMDVFLVLSLFGTFLVVFEYLVGRFNEKENVG